mgnify:CR=1 FL=1
MDRNLALEVARVTEAAALASARFMGRGDEAGADQAAVEAMRRAFNAIPVGGTVVIGEGSQEQTRALYVGEQIGAGDLTTEVALDALLELAADLGSLLGQVAHGRTLVTPARPCQAWARSATVGG